MAMIPAPASSPGDVRFAVPWDLSEWADRDEIFRWLARGIDQLDWANPQLLELQRMNPAYQPRLALTLLGYGYSLGVCESEEVMRLWGRDAVLRRMIPGPPLSGRELARFRRENRGLLKWTLTEVFKCVLREKLGLGDGLIPAGIRRCFDASAAARLDVARDLDHAGSLGS